MKKVKKTALSAILAALAVAVMYVGSLWGKIDIATAVAASVCVMITLGEFGYKRAVSVYLVTAVLSFVLVPSKTAVILFIVLFGLYPVVKSYSETRFGKTASYIAKYIYLNVTAAVLIVLASVFAASVRIWIFLAVAVGANALLPVYDTVLSWIMAVYYDRIRKKLL